MHFSRVLNVFMFHASDGAGEGDDERSMTGKDGTHFLMEGVRVQKARRQTGVLDLLPCVPQMLQLTSDSTETETERQTEAATQSNNDGREKANVLSAVIGCAYLLPGGKCDALCHNFPRGRYFP